MSLIIEIFFDYIFFYQFDFNMSFKFKEISVLKSKKVFLPGLDLKELKCLSSLFQPIHFLIPMIFVLLIAQIVDNIKDVLKIRDIQRISSIKLYAKLISSDEIVVSFSILRAISKTLGADLEVISVLNNRERILFIKQIEKKIVNSFTSGKIYSNNLFLLDPVLLLKHRLGIALHFRNLIFSTALFHPSSLVIGLSLKDIGLQIILESVKLIWLIFNLRIEEFYFFLYKQSYSIFKKFSLREVFEEPKTIMDSFRIIVFSRLRVQTFFSRQLSFYEDQIVLRSEDNLVFLERELGFIKRPLFHFKNDFSFFQHHEQDLILKNSIQQRNYQKYFFNHNSIK